MPLARRQAAFERTGTLEQAVVHGRELGEIPVSWTSRTSPAEYSTSPEEFVAAAYSSCYSMVLNDRGTPSERIRVSVDCALGEADKGFRISTIDLDVQGRVLDLDGEGFQSATEETHRVCSASNALKHKRCR